MTRWWATTWARFRLLSTFLEGDHRPKKEGEDVLGAFAPLLLLLLVLPLPFYHRDRKNNMK